MNLTSVVLKNEYSEQQIIFRQPVYYIHSCRVEPGKYCSITLTQLCRNHATILGCLKYTCFGNA